MQHKGKIKNKTLRLLLELFAKADAKSSILGRNKKALQSPGGTALYNV